MIFVVWWLPTGRRAREVAGLLFARHVPLGIKMLEIVGVATVMHNCLAAFTPTVANGLLLLLLLSKDVDSDEENGVVSKTEVVRDAYMLQFIAGLTPQARGPSCC
jgi:hypothetical protein